MAWDAELDRIIKLLGIGNAIALRLPLDVEILITRYVDDVLASLRSA